MSNAAAAIRDYAKAHARHVPRRVYDPTLQDWVTTCDLYAGDRCDITAAYNHAAQIAEASA